MNHDAFQEQFDCEIAPLIQTLQHPHTVSQYERLGTLCEQFQLHALASHTFRRLTQIDPDNRTRHGHRFLCNLRKASGRSFSGTYSAIYN